MSKLEIVGGGVLYRNPLPGHQVVNAYLPFVLELAEGEWISVYRRATALYSRDGTLAVSRSTDDGNTWREDGLVWDPRKDDRPFSYSAPFLTRLRDGSLVLTTFGWGRIMTIRRCHAI